MILPPVVSGQVQGLEESKRQLEERAAGVARAHEEAGAAAATLQQQLDAARAQLE